MSAPETDQPAWLRIILKIFGAFVRDDPKDDEVRTCRHGSFTGEDVHDLNPGVVRTAMRHQNRCRKGGTVFAHINWPEQPDWVCCDGCGKGVA